MSDYPETYPDTRQDFYGSLLNREAEASTRLDGETVDVGPVTVHSDEVAPKDTTEVRNVDLEFAAAVMDEAGAEIERLRSLVDDAVAENNRLLNSTLENQAKLQDQRDYAISLENALIEQDELLWKYERENHPGFKVASIRVYLSRQLTWSEVEKLTTDHHVVGGRLNVLSTLSELNVRVNKDRRAIYLTAALPSRVLYEAVAAALDAHFVNVHPEAVRTFTEYSG